MKKLILILTAAAFVGYFAASNVFAVKVVKPKPFFDSKACYTWSKDGNTCDGNPTDCDCKNHVNASLVSGLNNAIANGTVNDFFSNSNNVAAFNLSSAEAAELITPGVWIISSMNQQEGTIYYVVGSSAVPSLDNPDFVLPIVPSNN